MWKVGEEEKWGSEVRMGFKYEDSGRCISRMVEVEEGEGVIPGSYA